MKAEEFFFPTINGVDGLTKREYVAALLMAAIRVGHYTLPSETAAEYAIKDAEVLLKMLEDRK